LIKFLYSKISWLISRLHWENKASAYQRPKDKEWTLSIGKLYRVKENVLFSVCLYDDRECFYKGEQNYLSPNTRDIYYIRSGDILLYLKDVWVAESPGRSKIYRRPLFLKGEHLYVPLSPDLRSHYHQNNKKFTRFEEKMEQL